MRISVVVTLFHRRALAGVVLRHMARVREDLRPEGIDLDLVAVASNDPDEDLAADSGWAVVWAENSPLAAKWVKGLDVARYHAPDAVAILGSDDLVSADVFRFYARRLADGMPCGLLGLRDCYVYRPADGRAAHWTGYAKGSPRHGESIGTARCLPRALLEALDWQPWDETLDEGLDSSMRARIAALDVPPEETYQMAQAGPVIDVKHDPEKVGIGSWAPMTHGSVPVDADLVLCRFSDATIVDLSVSCDPVASAPRIWQPCEAPVISAALILRDEAANIESCLRSLSGVVDEVVVILDTATTDRTGEIVAKMGARVIPRAWTGDFAAARNASLDACRGRWRLVIDGDEILAGAEGLRDALLADTECDAFAVMVISTDGRSPHSGASLRIFGPATRYRYPAHNRPFGYERPGLSDAVIETSWEGVIEAHTSRTIPMLLAMTEDPQWAADPHASYYLGQSYAVLEDWPSALRWAEESIRLAPAAPEYAASWGVKARALVAEKRTAEALRTMAEGLALHGQGPSGGYADLWRFLTTMGVAGWCIAAARPGEYAFIPQEGMAAAARLPEVAEMLGLPLKFRRGSDA